MFQGKLQEILEQYTAVAAFVGVLPAGGVCGPVLKGFFEVELDAVYQLPV